MKMQTNTIKVAKPWKLDILSLPCARFSGAVDSTTDALPTLLLLAEEM
jgi:hypothetical protein